MRLPCSILRGRICLVLSCAGESGESGEAGEALLEAFLNRTYAGLVEMHASISGRDDRDLPYQI